MKAVADENMADLAGTFGRHLDLRLLPGRSLESTDLGEAEVLLVRSVTPVNEALLAGSRVRFVGTATIGTDHLDTDYLDDAGIAWAAAPGCNADAAAQYTLGMILLACRRLGRSASALRAGIIGYGNVGARVHALLDTLGIPCIVRDPPLAETGALPSVSMERVLDSDIVCLHTPLTHDGPWPTAGMIDADALAAMPTNALLVNSARGGIIQEEALCAALERGNVQAALDVWPSEPSIDPALLASTTVASPHVAGYSVEGKVRGTRMIYDAFLDWAELTSAASDEEAGTQDTQPLVVPPDSADWVVDAVIMASRVRDDDERLREAGTLTTERFDALRRAHAPRHEFAKLRVAAPDGARHRLEALGFTVE